MCVVRGPSKTENSSLNFVGNGAEVGFGLFKHVSIFFVLLNISVARVYRTAFFSATVISSLVLNS